MKSNVLLSAALLVLAGAAQAGQNYVEYMTPRGGQRGTTVEVTFYGSHLENPKEVLFYRSGIEASDIALIAPDAKEAEKAKDGGKKRDASSKVRAKFKIAPDCALGEHQVRLYTASHLSELVTFWVGLFPTVEEAEKKQGENDDVATAQAVPLNCTVQGQIHSGEVPDIDCFRVEAKKGQRLSVEVEAVRLATRHDGGENDMVARILDSKGKELARNDDNALFIQDPAVSMMVPADGAYIVELSQQMYQSASQALYRAHIGTFTRPMAVYPMGGQAGEKLSVRILGDPTGAWSQTIELPKQAGSVDFFGEKDGPPAPSPNTLRVSAFANTLEAEPNDAPDTATPVTALPAALNGIIDHKGDVDCFRFHVEKGQVWHVRTFARALGTPLDPKVWIRRADSKSGANEVEKDDATLAERDFLHTSGRWRLRDQFDPSFIFTPQNTGDYILGIEDTRGQGGPDYVYRIEIDEVHPTVVAYMSPLGQYNSQYSYRNEVPAGNRLTRNITIGGTQGTTLKGEYELEAVGLPKGVIMIAPKFSAGATTLPVQFVAAPDAELKPALIEIRAHPLDKSVKTDFATTQGMTFIDRGNSAAWHYVTVDKIAIAVTQTAPYSIELVQPEIALVQNGELALEVKIQRRDDFKGPVELKVGWLPSGVTGEQALSIPATATESKFTLQANSKASPGAFKIALNGSSTGSDTTYGIGNTRVSTGFIELKVSEPYLTVVVKRASVERGKTGSIVCELKQNKAFPGVATATLKRLPHGVTIVEPFPKISAQDKQAEFHVEATSDALVGLYKDISCEVTITENGQSIRQQTGSGVLRVDPSKGVTPVSAKE